tara:strand:- start:1010 stop:2212 length:1203 start_codon:yes stop_codon:yes gene_type:complete
MAIRNLLLMTCLLAACSSAPITPLEADNLASPWPHAAPSIDALDPEAIWSAGDYVRYRVESNATGERREWQLELALPELPPEITAAQYPGFMRYADPASGTVRMRNAFANSLSNEKPGSRAFRYVRDADYRVTCTRLDGTGSFVITVPMQAQAHVWQSTVDAKPGLGLSFLFRVLMQVDRLMEELLDIVRPPSMLSVLSNGMKVYVDLELQQPDPLEVIEVETPIGRVPAFWLPATITANGQPALNCRFLITWIQSPLLLPVGVLRIEGHHPDNQDKRIVAHLIDARRGDPDAATKRSNELGPPGIHRGMTEPEFLAQAGKQPIQRYRLHHPQRNESVDLLVVDLDQPWGRYVAVLCSGRLVYGCHPGWVHSYLRYRDYDVTNGPYSKHNQVSIDDRGGA